MGARKRPVAGMGEHYPPSPQGREDFSSTTQKAMCRPPQIRHAALAGKVVQGQRSNAMVSADADVSTKHGFSIFVSLLCAKY
jgi:hypothetical protein